MTSGSIIEAYDLAGKTDRQSLTAMVAGEAPYVRDGI
jgi:hypothetical protein